MMLGYTEFMGQQMQQCDDAVPTLLKLIASEKPARIIEIGTGMGGLSLLMKIACNDFITFDIVDKRYNKELFKQLDIDFRIGNIFDKEKELKKLIKTKGKTIVLCDGGDKPREFKTFSKYLKKGDLILGHDFSRNKDKWPWMEITENAIEGDIEKYKFNEMAEVFWLCGRKMK